MSVAGRPLLVAGNHLRIRRNHRYDVLLEEASGTAIARSSTFLSFYQGEGMRRLLPGILLLTLLAGVAGCNDNNPTTPTTPTTPNTPTVPTVTENFTGTLNKNGGVTFP